MMGYRRTYVQCLMCAWRMQQRATVAQGRGCLLSKWTSSRPTGWSRSTAIVGDCVGWGALCGYPPPPPPPIPFGLSSAPKIFTAVADAIEWIARHEGIQSIRHYLDDFLPIAPPDSEIGQMDLDHDIYWLCLSGSKFQWHCQGLIQRRGKGGKSPP